MRDSILLYRSTLKGLLELPAEDLKGRTAVDIGDQVHKMMADDLGPDLVLKTEE